MIVVCVVVLVAAALVADPSALRRRAPHAAEGAGRRPRASALALLAWPVWFALEGPAHLTGLVWPNVGVIGGFIPSSFVATSYPPRKNVFLALGGYEGAPLASAAYLGWSFLAVLVAGLVAFWRDRRLWFFGFLFVVCVAFSLGERHGQWEPAWIFTHDPGARQRDRAALHGDRLPGRRGDAGRHPRPRARVAARLARRARRAGRGRRRPGAHGRHLRRASALRHAGR